MRFCMLLFVLPLTLFASRLQSAPGTPGKFDWPQWQGPNRDGMSKETGLLKNWTKGEPKQLWKIDGLGASYSTPSIAAGRIFIMGNKDKFEYVFALDETDGKPIWQFPVGPERSNGGADRQGARRDMDQQRPVRRFQRTPQHAMFAQSRQGSLVEC